MRARTVEGPWGVGFPVVFFDYSPEHVCTESTKQLPEEVSIAIKALKLRKAVGEDGILAEMLIDCHHECIEPLASWMNAFLEASATNLWEHKVRVSLIHKISRPVSGADYRPIAVVGICQKNVVLNAFCSYQTPL